MDKVPEWDAITSDTERRRRKQQFFDELQNALSFFVQSGYNRRIDKREFVRMAGEAELFNDVGSAMWRMKKAVKAWRYEWENREKQNV